MNSRTRLMLILSGVAVVALVAVGVLVGVMVGQNAAKPGGGDDSRHRAIVSICERQTDDPYGAGLDEFTRCVDDLGSSDRP